MALTLARHLGLIFILQAIIKNVEAQGTVSTDCTYADNTVEVKYMGVAEAVLAVNNNGDEWDFDQNIATVTFSRLIYLTSTNPDAAVFDKDPNMELYTIRLQARHTVPFVQSSGDEEFLVQCSFEKYADDVSSGSDVEDSVSSPVIISQNAGDMAVSNFTVEVVKINEASFTDQHIHLGRVVKLKASMTGTTNETKFHITNCEAFSSDMQRKAVLLTDGCGTGFPFSTRHGFELRGLTAISPSFRMFRIKQRQGILFKCSFIVCNENCPENSCAHATRRKRDASSIRKSPQHDKADFHPSFSNNVPSSNENVEELQEVLQNVAGKRDIDIADVSRINGGYIINVPPKSRKQEFKWIKEDEMVEVMSQEEDDDVNDQDSGLSQTMYFLEDNSSNPQNTKDRIIDTHIVKTIVDKDEEVEISKSKLLIDPNSNNVIDRSKTRRSFSTDNNHQMTMSK